MPEHTIFLFDGWRLDTGRRTLTDPAGRLVSLTSGDFSLLVTFCTLPQETISRERLVGRICVGDRAADVRVYRLRRKLEDSYGNSLIKTIRHDGYYFSPTVSFEG